MSTKLELLDWKYYDNGKPISGNSVGWKDGHFRVFGCTFETPSSGASHISFKFGYHYPQVGSSIPLRFSIGIGEESYPANGRDSEYDGEVTVVSSHNIFADTVTVQGECEKMLLPNTKYYLWLFPEPKTTSYYGWYMSLRDVFVDGSAGVIRIKEGESELLIVPTVKENGEFVTLAATVKNNEEFSFFG